MKLLIICLAIVAVSAAKSRKSRCKSSTMSVAVAPANEVHVLSDKETKELVKAEKERRKEEIRLCNAHSIVEHYEPVLSRLYCEKEAIENEMNQSVPFGKEYRKLSKELYRIEENIFKIETKMESAGLAIEYEN